jgi:hypothetical protein
VNLISWNASITVFGKWQKNPLEHSLQDKQSSTSAIPYGERIGFYPISLETCGSGTGTAAPL